MAVVIFIVPYVIYFFFFTEEVHFIEKFTLYQGLTASAVNRSNFTNSDFNAPKNAKVGLELFTYYPKNDVHIC